MQRCQHFRVLGLIPAELYGVRVRVGQEVVMVRVGLQEMDVSE